MNGLSRGTATALLMTLTIAGVIGVVVLLALGRDVGPLLSLLVPVVGSLVVAMGVDARATAQDRVITEIQENTNGRLTERIRSGAEAATESVLARHGLIKRQE